MFRCLAEDLLAQTIGDVPCSVVRPSMVVPAWREPYPGWSDTFNGPTGSKPKFRPPSGVMIETTNNLPPPSLPSLTSQHLP